MPTGSEPSSGMQYTEYLSRMLSSSLYLIPSSNVSRPKSLWTPPPSFPNAEKSTVATEFVPASDRTPPIDRPYSFYLMSSRRRALFPST